MFQTQEDPIGAVSESEGQFPVRVEVPHIVCRLGSVVKLVSFNIGETIRTAVGPLLGPWAKRVSLVVTNALDPSVAEGFPNFPDLVLTWTCLNWHILAFIEPWWTSTLVHIGEDPVSVGVEQFGDCCDMEVKSAVVENFDGSRRETRMENSPFHKVYVLGTFGGHDVGFIKMKFHIGPVKSNAKRGEPPSFEVW
jgi:hypothetical protein